MSYVSFPKKTVSEHQFRENEVACECCYEKLWGFKLVSIIQYMFSLQLQSFKSQNCDVYFSNAYKLETSLPASPILVIIYFKILCSNTDMAKKSITFTATPKALCFLLGPNESRGTQCFDNLWILQPMEHNITAAEYATMLHTFERSIFTYSFKHLHGYGLQICEIISEK